MLAGEYLLTLAAGGLLTWLIQTSGLMRPLWALHPLLKELGQCDLCLGFWVFLILYYLAGQPVFGLWPAPFEPWVAAAAGTTLAHTLRMGWISKYGFTIVE